MRWQGVAGAAVLTLFLTGCSTAAKREAPPSKSEPAVQEPSKPPAVSPQSEGERLQAFFIKYYQSRHEGDMQAITAMTGGSYQSRALQTMAEDRGATFEVQTASGPPERIEVVRLRNAARSGITFMVKPTGETYRIVDMIDPRTGRWLSERPAATSFPKEMQADLDQFVQTFYKARSFDGPVTDEQRTKLFSWTRDGYNPYLTNQLRNPENASEQFSVASIAVGEWVPEGSGQAGTAEVLITRTLTTRGKDGGSATTTGVARLRIKHMKLEDDTTGWRVVDGFLADEGAWVSTLGWKGLLTAA